MHTINNTANILYLKYSIIYNNNMVLYTVYCMVQYIILITNNYKLYIIVIIIKK
jgi:hypothetical protein